MFERIVWQYWENSSEYPDGIPYINLCHQSVDSYCNSGKGYKVIRLNQHNISKYIDDINPYIFNMKNNLNQLAQKADYFRAKLLCKYGGIWLDSDAIVINSLDSIFDKLDLYDFYGYKFTSPCVWAFACHKDANIMKKWCENNEKVLNETKGNNIYYGELGHQSLQLFMNEPNSFFDDAISTVHSINHRNCWIYMDEDNKYDIKDYIHENQPFIMLNNNLIYDHIKKLSIIDLKKSKLLLADFFRLANVI